MKVSTLLLSAYTDVYWLLQKQSVSDLQHLYSIRTAEIEDTHTFDRPGVVVGKVLSSEKHPKSEKLWVCQVSIGDAAALQILTASPNGGELVYVPVATIGTQLAPDFAITERPMAGMMSQGMLCGDDELGLRLDKAPTVLQLEKHWDTEVLENMLGKPFFDLPIRLPGLQRGLTRDVPLRSVTFDIDNKFITNRPDLFAVRGNAREMALVGDSSFVDLSVSSDSESQQLDVNIESDKVLSYRARRISVSTAGTTLTLRYLLAVADLASHSDLVDLTNLAMNELGQPMHAFDADKISGAISVRMAHSGETFTALDGKDYTLTDHDLVIADEKSILALAGIIGGMHSAVSDMTKSIVLESATFDSVTVRLSSQRHGIRTDASTRYEKSLDPLLTEIAVSRYIDFLTWMKKDFSVESAFDFIRVPSPIIIETSLSYLQSKTGLKSLEYTEVERILKGLWFTLSGSPEALHITVPSWRATKDVSRKEDIAEEVARISGYDRLPTEPLSADLTPVGTSHMKSLERLFSQSCRMEGGYETIAYSFTNAAEDALIGMTSMEGAVSIVNALSTDHTHMRRSLATGALKALQKNAALSPTWACYEIGVTHAVHAGTITAKKEGIFAITGTSLEDVRGKCDRIMLSLVGDFSLEQISSPTENFLHGGKTVEYRCEQEVIAVLGALHPRTVRAYELTADTYLLTLSFDALMNVKKSALSFREIGKYQSTTRELNFVMDEQSHTGMIAESFSAIDARVRRAEVVDIFRDALKVGEGKKSVTFRFDIVDENSTPTEGELSALQEMLIRELTARHTLSLRI